MQISIIRVDGAVYKDRVSFSGLDLSAIPANTHALQFNTESNKGHIEYVMDENGQVPQNMQITSLPDWAVTACAKWDEAKAIKDAHDANDTMVPAPNELQPQATGIQQA